MAEKVKSVKRWFVGIVEFKALETLLNNYSPYVHTASPLNDSTNRVFVILGYYE